MNQSVRKNSVASRSRPSPGQSANKGTIIRPKRCYNCQKMVAGDKYVLELVISGGALLIMQPIHPHQQQQHE